MSEPMSSCPPSNRRRRIRGGDVLAHLKLNVVTQTVEAQ